MVQPDGGYSLRIRKIQFKIGNPDDSSQMEIDVKSIVIIVGPNNSGKSLCLREIEEDLGAGGTKKLVEHVDIEYSSRTEKLVEIAEEIQIEDSSGQSTSAGTIMIPRFSLKSTRGDNPTGLAVSNLETWLRRGNDRELRANLVQFHTIRLAGYELQRLIQNREVSNLDAPPDNHLMNLLKFPEKERLVRRFCSDVWPNLFFLLDNLTAGQVRIRMSNENPADRVPNTRVPLDREFLRNATPIEQLGSGIQLFVGMAAALIGLNQRFILLDDPDVFLHPPLARVFGQKMTEIALKRKGHLFVSTHSPDFVQGCLEASRSKQNVTIIRLTYDSQVGATVREVSPLEIESLRKDAFLRTTHVYKGFFYQSVIVTEGDPDRVFYDVVNQIMLENDTGISDTHFIHTYGHQNEWKAVKPLRKIGLPAVAIVDFDVVYDGGTNLSKLKKACLIEDPDLTRLQYLRAQLLPSWKSLGKKSMKGKGIDTLSDDIKKKTEAYLVELTQYGLFVVPYGELESWNVEFGISSGDKMKRIVTFLSKVDTGSISIGSERIWGFMRKIQNWLGNSKRKGLS